jgi:hypothetical protein
MLGLPKAGLASVDRRKIIAYLLADNHPAGRAKAAFFRRFGFAAGAWPVLRDALLMHALSAMVVVEIDTAFGKKYILDGEMTAPDGRKPQVRTVWFVTAGEVAPRFVTAYPARGAAR